MAGAERHDAAGRDGLAGLGDATALEQMHDRRGLRRDRKRLAVLERLDFRIQPLPVSSFTRAGTFSTTTSCPSTSTVYVTRRSTSTSSGITLMCLSFGSGIRSTVMDPVRKPSRS
jgi:hypothetical protein